MQGVYPGNDPGSYTSVYEITAHGSVLSCLHVSSIVEWWKSQTNWNHKQYTCPSSEGNHWWIAAYHKAEKRSPLAVAGLYAHASRLDRHLPQILSVCCGGIWGFGGVMRAAAWGDCLTRLYVFFMYFYFFLGNPLTWLILVCKYCLDSFWLTLFLYSKTCHVKSWSWDIHLQVGRIPWVWWPFWLHRQAIHVSWQPSGTPSLGCQFKVPAIQKGIYCFTRFFFPMVFSVTCWSLYPEVRLIHYKLFQKLWP